LSAESRQSVINYYFRPLAKNPEMEAESAGVSFGLVEGQTVRTENNPVEMFPVQTQTRHRRQEPTVSYINQTDVVFVTLSVV